MAPAISPSRLNILRCPARYKAEYIEGIDVHRPGWELGGVFHEAAAEYVRHCSEHGGRDKTEGLTIMHRHKASAELPTDLIAEFERVFRQFLRHYKPVNRPLGVELKLAADADGNLVNYDSEDAIVRGRVDVVEETRDARLQVVDWKTSYAPIHREIQAKVYIYLAARAFRTYPDYRVRFYYPRLNEEYDLDYQDSDLEQIADEVEAAHRKLRGMVDDPDYEWPARPSSLCYYCPVKSECPALSLARRYDAGAPLTSEDEARDAAERLVALDAERKDLRSALKDYCNFEGRVDAGDIEVGYFDQERWELDLDSALPLLREWDAEQSDDLVESARISGITSKLKADKREALVDRLVESEALTISEQTQFTHKKGSKDNE